MEGSGSTGKFGRFLKKWPFGFRGIGGFAQFGGFYSSDLSFTAKSHGSVLKGFGRFQTLESLKEFEFFVRF